MRTVINVAAGAWYPLGQRRLSLSLDRFGESAERLFWKNAYPPHSPTHQETPYAFKPWAFCYALMQGFEKAIWLDSSVWLLKPLDKLWDWIDEDGYLFAREGWTVGEWANDRSLSIMGINRGQANEMPLVEGKVIGLDLRHPVAVRFLYRWVQLAQDGAFDGSWQDHRHDITCAGFLAADMGLKLRTDILALSAPKQHFLQASGM